MTIGTIRINLLQEILHIYLEFFIHGLFLAGHVIGRPRKDTVHFTR